MDVPQAIKSLREHLKLSQQGLAVQMALSVSAVSKYEQGGRGPEQKILSQFHQMASDAKRPDLAAVFARAIADSVAGTDAVRRIVETMFSAGGRAGKLSLRERTRIGSALQSIWILAGKPRPTAADRMEIRRLASEAHKILDGVAIEDIPGDWQG